MTNEKMRGLRRATCAVCVALCALLAGCRKKASEPAGDGKPGEASVADLQRQLEEALKK